MTPFVPQARTRLQINNSGGAGGGGTLPERAKQSVNSALFTIRYLAGTGNDVMSFGSRFK